MTQTTLQQPAPAVDPTVCNAAELAQIQAQLGVSLSDTDPKIIEHIVTRSKQAGNEAFRQKNYRDAIKMYSQAIAGASSDHTLFANRSAAYLAVGLYEEAVWDGRKAATLAPSWPKAYYRMGCAYLAMSQWEEAVRVLQQGLDLEPGNADMAARLGEAQRRAASEASARRAQTDTERRGIVAQLRAARRQDQQLAQLNQFKQSMVGPDWELEDLEWRPTFLPAMKLKPLRPEVVLANPRKRMLASYLAALADLAHPKQALRILEDTPRLQAFHKGIAAALQHQPASHVLVLGAGGGLLPLLAAQAGAERVTAVERSRMLYRMAKQCLESNEEQHGDVVGRVKLLDRRLQAVGVQGEALPPDALLALQFVERQRQQQGQGQQQKGGGQDVAPTTGVPATQGAAHAPADVSDVGPPSPPQQQQQQQQQQQPGGDEAAQGEREPIEAAPGLDAATLLPSRASVMVTDMLDHSVLGMGLLPALDYAAERLLVPGAVVVPHKVEVYALLLELHVGTVSGFDLSGLNTYWWHPHSERLDLQRLPHRRLSAPFPVHTLDLQARLDARLSVHAAEAKQGGPCCESSGNGSSSTADTCSSQGSCSSAQRGAAVWELDGSIDVPVTADGQWNAIAFWFEVHADAASTAVVSSWGEGRPTSSSTSSSSSGSASCDANGCAPPATAAAKSWDQAVQYVDSQAVSRGTTVRLRVRQDSGQYVFTSHPPQCRPRHALVPRWHFDMVLDQQRNDAYDAAIRRAVQRKRDAGCRDLLALDVGAGSGLLSMMAARAGADSVYAAEISQHMCDVGEEACIMNGFLGRITMLDRDARRLDVLRKPDGTPPDLPRRADLVVYEVFDSGCIGEGVLHLLAAAQSKLLASDAAMVPLSARVYCQPIQMRVGQVLGFDCSQANRWRWRPDYEGVELGRCRDQWVALGEPVEAFFFDFQNAAAHMRPEEAVLHLQFTSSGVFNAVAMWFDLHLDEETTLSTSPYSEKGLTWQQAVQWVQEVEVEAGESLQLVARHDTYGISYSHSHSLPPEDGTPGQEVASEGESASQEQANKLLPGDANTANGTPSCVHGSQLDVQQQQAGHGRGHGQHTGVPLRDPAWQAAYERLRGVNEQLAKACVQNPLEYRAVAEAALQFAARPHDLGVDAQQAVEFCVKMMG